MGKYVILVRYCRLQKTSYWSVEVRDTGGTFPKPGHDFAYLHLLYGLFLLIFGLAINTGWCLHHLVLWWGGAVRPTPLLSLLFMLLCGRGRKNVSQAGTEHPTPSSNGTVKKAYRKPNCPQNRGRRLYTSPKLVHSYRNTWGTQRDALCHVLTLPQQNPPTVTLDPITFGSGMDLMIVK